MIQEDKIMVKRNRYTVEYRNSLAAEICTGTSKAVVSKREGINSTTLTRWVNSYLEGSNDEGMDKKEVAELRKKVAELSVLLANALLEVEVLKKTEKILKSQKKKESLSGAISPSRLASIKRVKS